MKKKTPEELISDDLDDMLKKNPEIEILQHGPLKVAVKKMEQYYKELKDIAIELSKNKTH